MTEPPEPRTKGRLASLSVIRQWAILLPASVLVAVLFELMGLPAALLLGPMIAGILLGANGGSLQAPRIPVIAAQTIVGCLVGRAVTGGMALELTRHWPLFLGVTTVMIATSAALGYVLARYKVLPGSTAVWGTAPGGASVMMVMSGAFHADQRLVAFMQYLRVVVVAALATIVAWIWVGPTDAMAHAVVWFPPLNWIDLGATLLIAGLGAGLGILLRIPAGALLVPMIAAGLLEGLGLITITLPPWLLALSYAFLGWSIGLGFTRESLLHATRALPYVLLSILVMIAVSVVLAAALVYGAGIDPFTAYLATSPGGIDTVAIIAASAKADVSFVMAMQTVRLVLVLAAGPPLARFLARRIG